MDEEQPALGRLAGANSAAGERVIAFANRYGFLGAPHAVVDGSGAMVGLGESLSYWLAQLAVFHHLVAIWDKVSRPANNSELSRRQLDALIPRADYGFGRTIDLGPEFVFLHPDELRGRALSEIVGERLRSVVSRRLTGAMHVALDPGKPLRFRPATMLAAVYLDLALELVGGTGARLRECDYCHNQYLASRRDSRFCSDTCRSQARHVRNASRTNSKEERS
jgi:hypothetical protein